MSTTRRVLAAVALVLLGAMAAVVLLSYDQDDNRRITALQATVTSQAAQLQTAQAQTAKLIKLTEAQERRLDACSQAIRQADTATNGLIRYAAGQRIDLTPATRALLAYTDHRDRCVGAPD